MWTEDERAAFRLRIQALWPIRRPEDRSVILGLWIEELQGYPVDVVLKALNQSRTGGCKKIPEAKDLKVFCEAIRDRGKPKAKSQRSGIVARLQELANSGPHLWKSPKTGAKWRISSGGMILVEPNSSPGRIGQAIPWGSFDIAHLEAIVANNEGHILKPGPDIPWHEFVRAGGVEQVITRTDARGESAEWLRHSLPAWIDSAECPF